MTLILKDQVSGKPIEIQKPLLPEHVEVGRLIWYTGMTSTFSWDCPAIITWVDEKRKLFRVRSLDDMREQTQEYPFRNRSEYADSRGSMRLTTPEDVDAYLAGRRIRMEESVEDAKASVASREKALAHFDEIRATLKI